MPISEQELEERRKSIGGSDVAKVLGLEDSFGNGADVWAEKVFGLKRMPKEPGHIKVGNICEPAIVEWCHREKHPDSHLLKVAESYL